MKRDLGQIGNGASDGGFATAHHSNKNQGLHG
jgi:hypothetical protein